MLPKYPSFSCSSFCRCCTVCAAEVFNFLLSLLKQHKEFLNGVAEVFVPQ